MKAARSGGLFPFWPKGTFSMRWPKEFRTAACLILAVVTPSAKAQDIPSLYSEYYGVVERVIDGDTLVVRLDLWPGLEAIYSVRARGIDAPELRGAQCPEEKLWAEQARSQVERLYGSGTIVRIENVELDSFGRAVADIRRWRSDRWLYFAEEFAEEMVERNMAEAWLEDWPDIDWCALATER
jgi:endonuclease YncB( thermonuclease family)